MSDAGHRHRSHRIYSTYSWHKHESPTIIEKPPVEKQKRMLYFAMDFGELTIDGFIDTSKLTSAISEADLVKIRLLAPQTILNEGPTPDFQTLVANGHLETPSATVELHFEVGDVLFEEPFKVKTNLTSPIIGLLFLQRNSTNSDLRQELLNFFFCSMQLKHAHNTYSNNNEPVVNPPDIMIQPGKQTVSHAKSQVYTVKEVTGIIQASLDLEGSDDLIIRPAFKTTQNRFFTVLINDFAEHPHILKKGCQTAIFSILTAKQAKYIEPVNSAPLRHLLDTNHDDAIRYVNAILKLPEPEESNETYWFHTPQETGDETQHTPIQKGILQKLVALKKLEQFNPKDNQESREQFLSKVH